MQKTRLLRLGLSLVIVLAFIAGGFRFLDWIHTAQKTKPLNVLAFGMLDDTPPFCFYNNRNTLVGINIDLAREIARRLGMQARIESVSFNRLTSGLMTKQYDLISLGSVTPHRAKVVRYVTPHLISSDVLLVHPGLSSIHSLSEFKGTPRTIGVYNGTSYIALLKTLGLADNMAIYPNQRDVFLAFYKHRVDALIMNAIVADDVRRRLDPSLIVAGQVRADRQYAFATRTGDLRLWRKVDDAIQNMLADGTIAKIQSRWTTLPVNNDPTALERPNALR